MYARIAHLYGPLSINSYGFMIAIGFLVFVALVTRDKRCKKLLTPAQCIDVIMVGFLAAFIGGRVVFLISQWPAITSVWQMLAFWEGGFSILGSIIGVLIAVPCYLRYLKAPILQVLDCAAIYAPLLQSISRLGCFFAGCCHGALTMVPWAVTYTDAFSRAPCGLPLHPAQLYSAAILFLLFCCMYFGVRYWFKRPGQIACIYLLGASIERFVIDMVRGDRIMLEGTNIGWLSLHQLLAVLLATGALLMLLITYLQGRKDHAQ
jgi:phosphatidylglycerol:prolipoprotein diacylglycerol transferase